MGIKYNIQDLTGQKFGHLTVLHRVGTRRGYVLWRCRCECGVETDAQSDKLKAGRKKFCDWRRHLDAIARLSENASRVRGHELAYGSWDQMRQRCRNPNHKAYKDYGGRGIKVCERWDSFLMFLEDMGDRPSVEYSVERLDVNGHYEPLNCKWGTDFEQRRNKRSSIYVEWEGSRIFLMDLCREKGFPYAKARSRLLKGWPLDEVFGRVPHKRLAKGGMIADDALSAMFGRGMSSKVARLNVTIPKPLMERLLALCERDRRSQSNMTMLVLEAGLPRFEPGWSYEPPAEVLGRMPPVER